MQNGTGRVGLASVSAAVVLLTVAVATMASWFEDDWFLFLPILMVGVGAYIMLVGLSDHSTSADHFKMPGRAAHIPHVLGEPVGLDRSGWSCS